MDFKFNTKDVFPFQVTIFRSATDPLTPEKHRNNELAMWYKKLVEKLTSATGQEPISLGSNMQVITFLIEGRFGAVTDAVRDSCDNNMKFFIVRIAEPYTASGLTSMLGWLRTRVAPLYQ